MASLFHFEPGKTYRVRLQRRGSKVSFFAAEAGARKGDEEEARAELRAPRGQAAPLALLEQVGLQMKAELGALLALEE